MAKGTAWPLQNPIHRQDTKNAKKTSGLLAPTPRPASPQLRRDKAEGLRPLHSRFSPPAGFPSGLPAAVSRRSAVPWLPARVLVFRHRRARPAGAVFISYSAVPAPFLPSPPPAARAGGGRGGGERPEPPVANEASHPRRKGTGVVLGPPPVARKPLTRPTSRRGSFSPSQLSSP